MSSAGPSKTAAPREKFPFYVTCTDKFMSGWGHAKGKTNKLVFCCRTYRQAEIVAGKLRGRDEMKYVNINSTKPSYKGSVLVQWFTPENEPSWYR